MKGQLKVMQDDRRKREVAEAKETNGRMMSADADMKRRVKEHAKLKATQDKEYSDLKDRHAKEMGEAEKTGKVPARHAVSHEGKKIDRNGLTSREAAEYRNLNSHFSNEHARVHNADEAAKSRHARYRSSAMTAKIEQARLSHHDEVSQKEEKALASFRRKIERKHEVA